MLIFAGGRLTRSLIGNSSRSFWKSINLIFWNLSAKTVDFPATDQDDNVGLVSGFSGSLFNLFMETGQLDSMSLIQSVIDSERYKSVREVFNVK